MQKIYKRLGDYIRLVKVKNSDLGITRLMGINVNKYFMPSVANIIGTDMTSYQIIEKDQFACNRMHVGRDDRIPIALSTIEESFLVSPAYDVFEIRDKKELLPEYLMMWFSRAEFDRNAWYYTDADVRGGLAWRAFEDMRFPLPHIDKQREIVKEYNVIQNRIQLNQTLIQKLEETAQAIYREWFVEFEFPDENGMPYKSNGGKMVWNEELGKEIPKEWEMKPIFKVGEIKAGGDKPNIFSETKTSKCPIPIYSNGITNDGLYGYTNKSNYSKNSITISARGTIGFCVLRREDFDAIVRLIVLIPKQSTAAIYLWQTLKQIEFDNSGSVQNQLTIPQISEIKILYPCSDILNKYDLIVVLIYQKLNLLNKENQKLTEMKELLLSRLATV